jgi:hypothetical protein
MMNILPRNPADREAKSPCDKNIRYPVCVPGHDSAIGTTFWQLWYMLNRKPASWMIQVTWSTLVDWLRAESLSTCGLGAFWQSTRVIRSWDHPLGRFSYCIACRKCYISLFVLWNSVLSIKWDILLTWLRILSVKLIMRQNTVSEGLPVESRVPIC